MLEELPKYFLSFLKNIPRYYFFALFVGFVGLILFAYGLIVYFNSQNVHENTIPENFTRENTNIYPTAIILPQKKIVVDIEGAVQHPGVYSMPLDSRVQDGLIAAGGLANSADRATVAKQINLAAKLSDGVKVYIPHVGEVQISTGSSDGSSIQTSDLVNINTASSSDLDALPGIGIATAQKIIQGRPYATIDELVSKNVITQKVFDKIKEKISI